MTRDKVTPAGVAALAAAGMLLTGPAGAATFGDLASGPGGPPAMYPVAVEAPCVPCGPAIAGYGAPQTGVPGAYAPAVAAPAYGYGYGAPPYWGSPYVAAPYGAGPYGAGPYGAAPYGAAPYWAGPYLSSPYYGAAPYLPAAGGYAGAVAPTVVYGGTPTLMPGGQAYSGLPCCGASPITSGAEGVPPAALDAPGSLTPSVAWTPPEAYLPFGPNGQLPHGRLQVWTFGQLNSTTDPFNTSGLSTPFMYVPWSTPLSGWTNAQTWNWWRERAGVQPPYW